MAVKIITIASNESKYLTALKQSVERVGLELHIINTDWKGFGTKVIELREYLQTADFTHFIFVDAYDTLFIDKPEPIEGILFGTEKQAWPDADAPYPRSTETWRYLNSGAYAAPVAEFLTLTDKYPIAYEDDDQRYFTRIYLDGGITLDHDCKVFQSMAFETPGDFQLYPFKNLPKNTTPAILHFNGKCHNDNLYSMNKSLHDYAKEWKDTPAYHQEIHESFIANTNSIPELKAHRDFVEQHVFGFGERSFPWMWNLIVNEVPDKFTFLEIGVFKGQTLSLVELLANMQGKAVKRYGVTPLSTEGGLWESDYAKDIETIHDEFKLSKNYIILQGLSEDPDIIAKASKLKLDILFVDGGHEERHIRNDIVEYAHLVKQGGYLVIDDCCNSMQMPFGYFQGIDIVTQVVDELIGMGNNEWEFVFSVVHNRVYRRK